MLLVALYILTNRFFTTDTGNVSNKTDIIYFQGQKTITYSYLLSSKEGSNAAI